MSKRVDGKSGYNVLLDDRMLDDLKTIRYLKNISIASFIRRSLEKAVREFKLENKEIFEDSEPRSEEKQHKGIFALEDDIEELVPPKKSRSVFD